MPGQGVRSVAGKGWVLLVEDDAATAAVLAEVLRIEGLEVAVAATGAEALAALAAARPHAVLLDHRLPDMDGEEVASRYRATPGPHAPLILMTAAHQPAGIAAEMGADALLAKPFELDELLSVLGRFLPDLRT